MKYHYLIIRDDKTMNVFTTDIMVNTDIWKEYIRIKLNQYKYLKSIGIEEA